MDTIEKVGSKGGAIFSADMKHRFYLWRDFPWQKDLFRRNKKKCAFMMLNPSLADGEKSDPTVVRCEHIAKFLDCDRLDVVNLHRIVSPDPKVLMTPEGHTFTPDWYLRRAFVRCDYIILAYGNLKSAQQIARAFYIYSTLLRGKNIFALKINNSGHPHHPLYLPKLENTDDLIRFRWKVEIPNDADMQRVCRRFLDTRTL